VNKTSTLLAVVICGIVVGETLLWASAAQQSAAASPDESAAIRQFDQAIANYLAMRTKLKSEVQGPVKDSSAAQVNNASDALAGGIQRARQGAGVGNIFSEPIATVIKRRIANAVRREQLTAVLADIDDEAEAGPAPKVHLRLPVSLQMATMPASLLKVLPVLPKELEYRILAKNLIIRDVDASLILDYIPVAVPR
jgi:hypothetical protein